MAIERPVSADQPPAAEADRVSGSELARGVPLAAAVWKDQAAGRAALQAAGVELDPALSAVPLFQCIGQLLVGFGDAAVTLADCLLLYAFLGFLRKAPRLVSAPFGIARVRHHRGSWGRPGLGIFGIA